jgi:hypothetical protein
MYISASNDARSSFALERSFASSASVANGRMENDYAATKLPNTWIK